MLTILREQQFQAHRSKIADLTARVSVPLPNVPCKANYLHTRTGLLSSVSAYVQNYRIQRTTPSYPSISLKRYASGTSYASAKKSAGLSATEQRLDGTLINQRVPSRRNDKRIKSVLIVNKLRTRPVVEAIETLLSHIHKTYPGTRIFHEDREDKPDGVEPWYPGNPAPIDLVITLGGDGTILHASSLFPTGAVPPVLSFSMGTLGFLLPFHIDDYAAALDAAFSFRATILHRMRLSCSFHDASGRSLPPLSSASSSTLPVSSYSPPAYQVMNELTLHRSSSPHLVSLQLLINGQHLTSAVADGLIVATPTGSTAYSLSAGGPIVHPALKAIILTPICPRSLSFRPLVFPAGMDGEGGAIPMNALENSYPNTQGNRGEGEVTITIRVEPGSRADAGVSMDGKEARILRPGEAVSIRASRYPIPCINRSSIYSFGNEIEHVDVTRAESKGEKEKEEDEGVYGLGAFGSRPGAVRVIDEGAYGKLDSGVGEESTSLESEKTSNKKGESRAEDDWVRDINSLLQYNATFRSKALLRGRGRSSD